MKNKRRIQRNKKLGIKDNNDMEIYGIKLDKAASTEFLFHLFNRHSIEYYVEDQNNEYFLINITGKNIEIIYDILLNELVGDGMTSEINSDGSSKTYLNDYGRKIDNIIGIFAIIKSEKDELEKKSSKLNRSRKKLKYNKYNEI